jgi:hypothetical protein
MPDGSEQRGAHDETAWFTEGRGKKIGELLEG